MTAKPKKPTGKGGRPSPAQEKAAFKEELASRIESNHESVQFDGGITADKIEQVLGVGNLKVYFQEVENNFANSRLSTKDAKTEKVKSSPIKIKKLSNSRPKKRRKQRGKISK